MSNKVFIAKVRSFFEQTSYVFTVRMEKNSILTYLMGLAYFISCATNEAASGPMHTAPSGRGQWGVKM
jgi:hypothetical protein